MSDPTFVLLHSPLLGPASWAPVREELDLLGFRAVAPRMEERLGSSGGVTAWRAYADAAAEAITDLGTDEVVLVPHSGAGPLVAAVADMSIAQVRAIVFVDAALPNHGWSRLDEMAAHDPGFARGIRADLEGGARFPAWTSDELAPLVPDSDRREAMLAEVQPRGLDFFTEPIPAPNWPPSGEDGSAARCAYLHLSSPYVHAAREAEALGWQVGRIEAGHFHGLVNPEVMASVISRLAEGA
ncbi:MAG: alpha/beta hydrolase [Dehalococcoidia bacterium]|nr:alpha/beta hydrolase [Dehalococcoidia bacterium]